MRVLRANTPEALSAIVQSINVGMQILGFGNDSEGHFLYYRTTTGMEKRVLMQIEKAQRNLRGGEASPKVEDTDVDTTGGVS